MTLENARPRGAARRAPKELINILATGVAIFVAVGLGSLLATAIPADQASVWLTAGAYLAPAAGMFALYWVIAQRF
ncbi:MAG TPA: hypothetical protein VIO94_02960 [Phenylobacterium sp.]